MQHALRRRPVTCFVHKEHTALVCAFRSAARRENALHCSVTLARSLWLTRTLPLSLSRALLLMLSLFVCTQSLRVRAQVRERGSERRGWSGSVWKGSVSEQPLLEGHEA